MVGWGVEVEEFEDVFDVELLEFMFSNIIE